MTSIMTVEGAHLQLGSASLFQNLHFGIPASAHIALVGVNGAGKTTLLRALAGAQGLDAGAVISRRGLTVGYLPQEVDCPPGPLLQEFVRSGRLSALEQQMTLLENALDAGQPADLDLYAECQQLYGQLGGWEQQERIQKLVDSFGLKPWWESRMADLSPGIRHRAVLARELLDQPDLLLLDEPTNHLDCEAIEILEQVLRSFSGALVFTSHDRAFLNRVATHLAWLDQGSLEFFSGNYDDFLVARAEAAQRALQREEDRRQEMKLLQRQLDSTQFQQRTARSSPDRDKLGYNARGERRAEGLSRTTRQAQAKLEALQNEAIAVTRERQFGALRFEGPHCESPVAFQLRDVTFSYGTSPLLDHFSLEIATGERVVLSGRNGIGKSTLLRLLAGELLPTEGEVIHSPQIAVGVLPQEPPRPAGTVSSWFSSQLGLEEETLRRRVLQIGFRDFELLHRPWSTLSVGQAKALWLLQLALQKPNALLLDEPTNHLDLDLLEHLEEALLLPGLTIVMISHDRRFRDRVATRVVDLDLSTNS